jgi:predicted nucleic acid-binding protein
MILVVDASVAVKWYLDEVASAPARELLVSDDLLAAPEFMQVEAASVFWKRVRQGQMSGDAAALAARRLRVVIDTWVGHADVVPGALDLASALDHPVYDCVYLAAAERLDGTLVTADARFAARLAGTPWAARIRPLAPA